MKRKNKALIMAATVTIVLLYLLLSHIEPYDIVTTLEGIDLVYLVAGFIIYIFCNVFRALRFHILLDKEIKIADLFDIVCIYNMVNNLAPLRAGELSYIYMLKKLHNKNAVIGVSTLIVSRLFDFVAIGSLFMVSAWMVSDRMEGFKSATILVSLFMIFCFLLLLTLFHGGEMFLDLLTRALIRMGFGKNKSAAYFTLKLRETVRAMEKMRNTRITILAIVSSFLIWITNFSVVYLVIKGMHFDIPMQIIVVGSTFTVLSTLLPVYGIAGLGTSQGLWTLVFLPLGIPLNQAIISAFGYYIVQMTYYLILGVYGMVRIKLTNQKQESYLSNDEDSEKS